MDLSPETPFRLVFGFFWLLNTFTRSYFQMKALKSRKVANPGPSAGKLGFRLLAVSYLVLVLYPVSPWVDFAHFDLPLWFRWTIGGGLLVVYLVFFVWTHVALGRHWSGLLEVHEDHALITSGPFHYVRHPMYASFFLATFGVIVFTANWFIGGLYFLATVFMYASRVSLEEKMMIDTFGDAYREYMENTSRLIPGYSRKASSTHVASHHP